MTERNHLCYDMERKKRVESMLSCHQENSDIPSTGTMLTLSESSVSNRSPVDISDWDETPSFAEEKQVTGAPQAFKSENHSSSSHYCSLGQQSSFPTDLESFVGRVIGPTSLMELVACPCCQQSLRSLEESATTARRLGSLMQMESDDDEEDAIVDDEDALPGVLEAGVAYFPRRILVEGWLHKKGTGQDWLGSRAWKPRWARLVLARVEEYECDVPLLLIYWYASSPVPSTVIVLESTVVMAVDLEDKDQWNSSRFEIRHVTRKDTTQIPVTRTFTAARKARNEWVYAISQALLVYEKQKAQARKVATWKSLAALGFIRTADSTGFDEVWTGDRFVAVEVRRPLSPSSIPPPPTTALSSKLNSPNIPRPPNSVKSARLKTLTNYAPSNLVAD